MELWLMETADIFNFHGHREFARTLVEEARQLYEEGSERAGYAEYLRFNGVFAARKGNRAGARKWLRDAINVADTQSAHMFRVRACHDLARMLAKDGDREGVLKILSPAYAWFTEGLDPPDLVQAKYLIEQLRP